MSTGMQTGGPGPSPSGLADVIDTILVACIGALGLNLLTGYAGQI